MTVLANFTGRTHSFTAASLIRRDLLPEIFRIDVRIPEDL